jgi:TonB-linked SusC/RagA family outer membrane protein
MDFPNYCLLRFSESRNAQMCRVMRITAAILLASALHVSAGAYSQKVTLNVRNESLEKVILEIGRQSGIEILYNNDLLRKAGTVTISVKDVDAREALSQALSATQLGFKVVEGMLVISPRVIAPPAAESIEARQPFQVITGQITGPDGSPLGSVTVTNKTTQKATQTDASGNFSIQANDKDVVEFSIVGYAPQERKVSGGKNIWSVVMMPHASSLNEVVMIGYGSSQRKDLTGSVSTVSGKDIQDIPFNTVDNALAGKAAGVQVTKTDGTPGGAVRIRVRGSTSLLGSNDPLYVIDGVPIQVQSNYVSPGYDVSSPVGNDVTGYGGVSAGMSTAFVNGLNSLGGLNPDDIESITILKDASATAIYGSKAANGVVIITTKRGKKDMKPQVTFNYYSTVTGLERRSKVLDATQYRTLITEAAKNDNDARDLAGRAHRAVANQIVNTPSQFFGTANTDWVKEVSRTSYSHNAEIAIQGGGGSSRYYTSVAFNSSPGVIKGTDYQRVVGKVNLESEISKHLKFITNFNIGYTNQNVTNGAYGQALRSRPDYTPYDSTGNYTNFANVDRYQ